MSTPRFYHAPPRRAAADTVYTIMAAAELSVQSVSVLCGGEKHSLFPVEEYGELRLWQGSLTPVSHADAITYTLYADLTAMGEYTVPLCPINLSPLAITELYLRPGTMREPYIEITNNTLMPIDLSNYQIMWKRGKLEEEGKVSILPITPHKGEEILPPHTAAALWIAYALTHDEEKPCLTEADFCAQLKKHHPYAEEDSGRIIRVEACFRDEDGNWHNNSDFAVFPTFRPWDTATFGIVPLGGSLADAVSRVTINDVSEGPWTCDTPVRRATLWQSNPFDGAEVRMVNSSAAVSPGRLASGQCIPDLSLRPAAILPIGFPSEYPLAEGDLTLKWQAAGCPVRASEIKLQDGDTTLCLAGKNADGVWSVNLSSTLLARLPRLDFTVEADNGCTVTALPLSITLIDNAGPIVTAVTPDNGYAAFAGDVVEYAAEYFDRAGVDAYRSRLYLDGMDISHKAVWTADGVKCSLEKLKEGRHKLALKLYDCLGNSSRTVTYVKIASPEVMHCYRGEVHSHTGDSDGRGTPEQAMLYARDEGGADYFAVTDHGHYLTPDRYAAQAELAADQNIPNRYAVLQGWEMTWNNETGYWGHMNVLESSFIHHDIRTMDMPTLFEKLAEDPHAIAMFNHPGYPWGNFDEFSHRTPEADALVCLDEIKSPSYDRMHALALSRGWHVAPVSNEDNHNTNWTTATNQTGYVLAPALTRQNIAEAMRARRTYTTSDPSLHLRFRINGAWLGSRIPAADLLTVDLRMDTDRPEGLGVIRLMGEDNIAVAEWDVGALQHFEQRIHIPAEFDYYYIKAINSTVPGDYTVSAPVWIEGRDKLTVTETSLALTGGEKFNLVTVTFRNNGEEKLTDLKAEFYLTPEDGFCTATAKPYYTVPLDSLAPGETATAERPFPNLAGRRRVSVLLRGRVGRRQYTAADYLLLTPVSIIEVLPDSSAVTLSDGEKVKDPFTYAVLFNHTNAPLSLDGALLRQWTKTGKSPLPEHCHPLDGITVQPRSPITLWLRAAGSTLTAEDFNTHYGTELTEGVDLILIDRTPLSNSHTASRRLDLKMGEEVVSRVHWNYATGAGKQPTADRALRYCYRGGMTVTSVCIDDTAEPAPGTASPEQIPVSRAHLPAAVELSRIKKMQKKQVRHSRKPEKKGVHPAAAAALGAASAAVGAAIGIGGTLLTLAIKNKDKSKNR